MPLDQKQLLKPIRKLGKEIKRLKKVPSPEQVHGLRTQSRRLEATLHALKLEHTKSGRSILKSIISIRKAAGKVRDMDVLTGLASAIANGAKDSGENRIQLLEELASKRPQFVKRLHNVVTRSRKQVLRRLKRLSTRIDQWIERTQMAKDGDKIGRTDPTALTVSLAGTLSAWTRLDRNNLHVYRITIKELCYVLELAQDPDEKLLKSLGDAKDAIGEWHDWCELENIARKLINDGALVKEIHSIGDQRFGQALRLATGLQRNYFGAEENPTRKRPGPPLLKEPILISAARMSA